MTFTRSCFYTVSVGRPIWQKVMKNTTGEGAGISSGENGTITIAEKNGEEEEEAGSHGKKGDLRETL